MRASWVILVVVLASVAQASRPVHPRSSASRQERPCSLLCWARRQLAETQQGGPWGGLRESFNDWNRTDARRPTQGSAYVNADGPDEDDEPGPPFTAYTADSSSQLNPSGVYYHEDGDQSLALDPQIGAWGGQPVYSSMKFNPSRKYKFRPTFKRQNPRPLGNAEDGDTDNTTTISHFTLEYGDQRGMQALSGTYEGARAASGSNSAFNLARRDSIGGSVFTSDNDAYGPTPGRPTLAKNGERRSVAFTDLPPNSAAQSGTGYGVVAASAGYEVAATARSGRAPLLPAEARATLGSRPPGENGLLDGSSRRGARRMLRHVALRPRKVQGPRETLLQTAQGLRNTLLQAVPGLHKVQGAAGPQPHKMLLHAVPGPRKKLLHAAPQPRQRDRPCAGSWQLVNVWPVRLPQWWGLSWCHAPQPA